MNKELRRKVFERATPIDSVYPICEMCGMEVATELHHSIGGSGKRRQHESVESCYALGHRCHSLIESKDGYEIRIILILRTQQRYFDQGLEENEVRKRMGGKLYLQ